MEYWLISVFIFIFGAIFVFCSKKQYKHKLAEIFLFMGIITLLFPVCKSLGKNLILYLPLNIHFLSQHFICIIDVLSAFFMGITSLILLLPILLNSKYKIGMEFSNRPEIVLLSVFSIITIMGVQNGEIAKTLTTNINCSNTVFTIIFIGLGLPLLFAENLFETFSKKCPENTILTNLFYLTCLYGLLRFTKLGAQPSLLFSCIIITIVFAYICFKLFKLNQTDSISQKIFYIKSIQAGFLILTLLIGIYGLKYMIPELSILGFLSSLLFLINILFANNIFQTNSEVTKNRNLKDSSNTLSSKYPVKKNIIIVGLCNCIGIPATLGFYAWGTMFASLLCGIIYANQELKFILVIIFTISLAIYLFQLVKSFFTIKDINSSKYEITDFKDSKFNFFFAIAAIIFGLFPYAIIKVIFVPVSFITNGIKFIEIFNTIRTTICHISLYITGCVLLLAIYKTVTHKLKNKLM